MDRVVRSAESKSVPMLGQHQNRTNHCWTFIQSCPRNGLISIPLALQNADLVPAEMHFGSVENALTNGGHRLMLELTEGDVGLVTEVTCIAPD